MTYLYCRPRLPTKRVSLKISWEWRDLWVGMFWDHDTRILYICPLPTFLLTFRFHTIVRGERVD